MVINEREAGLYHCCNDVSKKCIGKQCMAWKWQVTVESITNREIDDIRPPTRYKSSTHGFCGALK